MNHPHEADAGQSNLNQVILLPTLSKPKGLAAQLDSLQQTMKIGDRHPA
jgi:hypothetical protein